MATKKIKTYVEACRVLKIKTTLPDVSMLPAKDRKAIIAHYKLIKVVEALNTDPKTGKTWRPDWSNSGEYKYNAYFQIKADSKNPAGSGFSNANYGLWGTVTNCGSRLCFKSSELAMYAAKQFKDLYKEYFLYNK